MLAYLFASLPFACPFLSALFRLFFSLDATRRREQGPQVVTARMRNVTFDMSLLHGEKFVIKFSTKLL